MDAPATPIRLQVLVDSVGDDPTVHAEILADFGDVIRDARRLLAEKIPADLADAARVAHRAKGSARLVGAQALALALADLEDAALERRVEPCRAALATFDAEAQRCLRWLEAHAGGTS